MKLQQALTQIICRLVQINLRRAVLLTEFVTVSAIQERDVGVVRGVEPQSGLQPALAMSGVK